MLFLVQVLTNIVGSDTTSGVLTFVFYYLLTNPQAYEKLKAELDEAFPDPEAPLNLEKLTKLPYLSGVVDESLRLGTPFPGLPRVTPQGGAMIDGVFIPEGTIIGVPAYTQEIHPDNFWPEPESFRPERWLPEGLGPGSRAKRGAIMSFSFGKLINFHIAPSATDISSRYKGPFGCLGKTLAVQEMRIVTAKVLLNYDVKLAPSFDNAKFVEGIQNMRTTIFTVPLVVTATRRQ